MAATGNEYASQINYPAAYDTVIGVGASRADNTRAGYSNTGYGIDFMAPGGDLSRDQNNDGYADGVLQETMKVDSGPMLSGKAQVRPRHMWRPQQR